MSGIRSQGRRGYTVVPNWRWEDPQLDPYDLRVAGWLVSHADAWAADHVTRNAIARATGISAGKVSGCVARLAELGIVDIEMVADGRGTQRWKITVHHDIWETPPGHDMTGTRSPDDQGGGHDVTGGWSPGDRVEEQGEPEEEPQQENEERAADSVVGLVMFDDWAAVYPKKGPGKGEARLVWNKMSHQDRRDALEGARRHGTLITTNPGMYVLPAMDVWLRNRRWEDDEPRKPPTVAPPAPTGQMARFKARRAAGAQTQEIQT